MVKDEDVAKIKIERMKWKNRTYITYGICGFLFALTLLIFFGIPLETVKALQPILGWIYTGSFSAVGAYFGLSTWAELKGK